MSTDIGQLILSVTITILTVWLVHRFWEGFFEKRRPAFFTLLIIYAIGALIESYVSLGTVSTKTESFAVIGIVISKLLLVACVYLLSFFGADGRRLQYRTHIVSFCFSFLLEVSV